MGIRDRLSHAWNAFKANDDYYSVQNKITGPSYSYKPDRQVYNRFNDKSIVTAILTRIAVDCSLINIEHARLDENGRYVETIKSGLNNCLTLDANKDQTGKSFMLDAAYSLLDEGVIAIVPVDTDLNPNLTGSYDIETMRVGKVIEWYPNDVKVRIFNDKKGIREDIIVSKSFTALPENPFYSIMNAPNSTLQRIIRILNKLDVVNEQNSSGKLDLIIQLPQSLRSPAKREQAEARRKDIEAQLAYSKYGIAYIDATEHITQLNRPVENTLLSQVEYFMKLLYSQFGISENVFNGTATEEEMLNYYDRIINAIMAAITEEMSRKFLTKTARTQRQMIWYFRDPFDLVPVNKLAEIADTFIRNEILTKNEIRAIIGFKPSDDPKADELQNPQLYPEEEENQNGGEDYSQVDQDLQLQIDSLDAYDQVLDQMEGQLAQSAFTVYEEVLSHAEEDEIDLSDTKEYYGYLQHYASPYYDPVYAHEYYEKHKKLKGRNKLSEKGREVADYVTKQLNAERDKKIASSKETTSNKLAEAKNLLSNRTEASANIRNKNVDAKRSATQSAIENHKTQMDNQIKQLQDELAEWGASGKKGKTKEIRNKIARLREQNEDAKTKLQDELSSYSTNESSEHANRSMGYKNEYSDSSGKIKTAGSNEVASIKEEYENRLAQEMGRILDEYSETSSEENGTNSSLKAKIDANYAEKKKNKKSNK